MTKDERKKAIEELEKVLSNGMDTYSLNDGKVIIQTSYKKIDDILKAIQYFKRYSQQTELIGHEDLWPETPVDKPLKH